MGGRRGLAPLGPSAASMKEFSSEIASFGISGVHPLFAFPVLKWCRGRDRCGFTGRPRRGLGAEPTLSSGGAPSSFGEQASSRTGACCDIRAAGTVRCMVFAHSFALTARGVAGGSGRRPPAFERVRLSSLVASAKGG